MKTRNAVNNLFANGLSLVILSQICLLLDISINFMYTIVYICKFICLDGLVDCEDPECCEQPIGELSKLSHTVADLSFAGHFCQFYLY